MKKIVVIVLTVLWSATLFAQQYDPHLPINADQATVEAMRRVLDGFNQGEPYNLLEEVNLKRQQARKLAKGANIEAINTNFGSGTATDTVRVLYVATSYLDFGATQVWTDVFAKLNGPNPTGSMVNYFTTVSDNKMYLILKRNNNWDQLPQDRSFYVGDGGSGGRWGGGKMVFDWLEAHKSDFTIDFWRDLDRYHKKEVYFCLYFVGITSTLGGTGNMPTYRYTLQGARQWDATKFSSSNMINGRYFIGLHANGDSIFVNGFTIQSELQATGVINNIGVPTHELTHMFGIPDFYWNTRTDEVGRGPGNWDLMSTGVYGGDGKHFEKPVWPNPWILKEMGWATVERVNNLDGNKTVYPVETSRTVYWFPDNPESDEIVGGPVTGFLGRVTTRSGYNQWLPNFGGLEIYRVNEYMRNTVNNNDTAKVLVKMVQADGLRQLETGANRGDEGDVFPGSTGKTTFNGWDYEGNFSGITMTGITLSLPNVNFTSNTDRRGTTIRYDTKVYTNVMSYGTGTYLFIYKLFTNPTAFLNCTLKAIKFVAVSPNTTYEIRVWKQGNFSGTNPITPGGTPDYQASGSFTKIGEQTILVNLAGIGATEQFLVGLRIGPNTANVYASLGYTGAANSKTYYNAQTNPTTGWTGAYSFDGIGWNAYEWNCVALLQTFIDDQSLPVVLTAFTATTDRTGVTIKWRTESEIDNAGYRLWLQDLTTRQDSLLTKQLLPGQGSTAQPTDYSYTFTADQIKDHEYRIKMRQYDFSGAIQDYFTGQWTAGYPQQYQLSQNYPNPFNPTTTIQYDLPEAGNVKLEVYNLLGQRVAALVDGYQESGYQTVVWDASRVASGVYFYRLQAGKYTRVKKMMIIK